MAAKHFSNGQGDNLRANSTTPTVRSLGAVLSPTAETRNAKKTKPPQVTDSFIFMTPQFRFVINLKDQGIFHHRNTQLQ